MEEGQCDNDTQCWEGVPGPYSRCAGSEGNKTCICPQGTVRNPALHKCLLAANTLNQPCGEYGQCHEYLSWGT